MKVDVWYITEKAWRADPMIGYHPPHKLDKADYERIATVTVDSNALHVAADQAWEYCQNVEDNWTERNPSKAVIHVRRRRSSMVGDVFEVDGKILICVPVGFKEVMWL